MLNRTTPRLERTEGSHVGEYAALLRDALRSGLRALEDPAVESRVRNYFEQNPTFSRDPIHVAAVATRFATQQTDVASPGASQAPSVKL
jgi:hypothetical protein